MLYIICYIVIKYNNNYVIFFFQKLGENNIIPNGIKNNVFLPIKAATQASLKTFGEPVGEMISNIKKTYDEELEKSNREYTYINFTKHNIIKSFH